MFLAFFQAREKRIDFLDIFTDLSLIIADIGTKRQVFSHGQIGKDASAFRHEGDSFHHHLEGFQPEDAFAKEFYFAFRGFDYAHDRTQSCAFSGAVGTQ